MANNTPLRVGCAAGFSGDRTDAALPVVQALIASGQPAVLIFETLAERTLALAQLARRTDPDAGYEPLLVDLLRPVLAQYRAAHPGIEIDIADVLSEPCIDRVASGHADFALAAIRADTPALQAEPFCSDNFYLVCPADHPLARRRKAITAQDLAAWPFIHLARTSSVRQYLEAALHPQAMHTLMEVEQLATVMGMVRAGLGISVVPALTLFHFEQPGLVTRPLSLPGLTRQIYLVRRRDESLSVAAQALYALVMAERPGSSVQAPLRRPDF